MAKWKYFSYSNWNHLLPNTSGKLLRFMEHELEKPVEIANVLARALFADDTESGKIIWLRFWPQTGHFTAEAIDKEGHWYSNVEGERIPMGVTSELVFELVENSGVRSMFNVPLASVLKRAPDVSAGFQLYQHRFLDPSLPQDANQYVYVGITRRSWKERWKEHLGAARRGSGYIFHTRLREALEKNWLQAHAVSGVGLSEADAMNSEEMAVADYALYPDNPRGLNMIPGGYAGLRALHRLGALKNAAPVVPDNRALVLERCLYDHPRKGVANPLISALWEDENYAISVICGRDDRLSVKQVRLIRCLEASGLSLPEISSLVRARNIEQVRRVLKGETYSRVH